MSVMEHRPKKKTCKRKKRYGDKASADHDVRGMSRRGIFTVSYECDVCGNWHVGSVFTDEHRPRARRRSK